LSGFAHVAAAAAAGLCCRVDSAQDYLVPLSKLPHEDAELVHLRKLDDALVSVIASEVEVLRRVSVV
jgi:hypothetical protein